MIRQMFNKPRKFNTFLTRQVDPTELFWDLIFVVTLRYIIDSFVANYSPMNFLIGLIVFTHIYLFWMSFNVYNVNFHDVSHNNRILMTFMLSPLIIIASITDYSNINALGYLGFSLFVLKIMQAFIWQRAINIHETDHSYRSLNFLYKTEVITYVFCGFIALLIIIFPNLAIYILLIMLIIEIIFPYLHNYRKRSYYAFDRILIAERFLLFIILIFGEGFIGVVHIFQHYPTLYISDLIRGFIIYYTLYSMFLKLYDEYTINKESISTTFMFYLATYVISSMLLISAIILIGYNHTQVDSSMRVIALIGVGTYYGTYLNNSYRYLVIRKKVIDLLSYRYYHLDLISSIIALITSFLAIIFISNTMILLCTLCVTIILNTLHIRMRSKLITKIYEQDHTIVKLN